MWMYNNELPIVDVSIIRLSRLVHCENRDVSSRKKKKKSIRSYSKDDRYRIAGSLSGIFRLCKGTEESIREILSALGYCKGNGIAGCHET